MGWKKVAAFSWAQECWKVTLDCQVPALLAHDGVTERRAPWMKIWGYSEDWNISISLYRREVRVLEEGKRVGPVSGKWAWILVLVWEAGRAYVNKYQLMIFWSKKDYPLRKSKLCLWVYVLCLGEFGWSTAIKSCTKCWAVNTRTRHPSFSFSRSPLLHSTAKGK